MQPCLIVVALDEREHLGPSPKTAAAPAPDSRRRGGFAAASYYPVVHLPLAQTAGSESGQGQNSGVEILLARSASYCACAFTLIAAPAQFVQLASQKLPSGSRTQSESTLQDWS